jgi:hypothetical protein
MSFYQGNPVGGEIHFVRVQGLGLESRPMGLPLAFYNSHFRQYGSEFIYDEKKISRIDYRCELTKVGER